MSELAAEYERLRQMKLGHSRADIRLRVRRAILAHLAYRCPYCGAGPWERCHVRDASRLVSQSHSARNWLAVDALRQGIPPP